MFTLGGCTAINELFARRGAPSPPPIRDAYKEIWDLLASRQPHSDNPDRLVIPRSFSVTEWSYMFARIFERVGVPVHVDDVRESDLLGAQSFFHVDTCAPHMGAVGQYRRLAGEPHSLILAPQIENLPCRDGALGLTCTVNQGGVAVACNLASVAHPGARFHLLRVQLRQLEAGVLADQMFDSLKNVFAHYGIAPSPEQFISAIEGAIDDHRLKRRAQDDPLVRGKRRLLYFDNQGDGPCRQGQYAQMHAFVARKNFGGPQCTMDDKTATLPCGASLQVIVGREDRDFNFGIEEWALYRAHQGAIAQAVLSQLLFTGGALCANDAEYR